VYLAELDRMTNLDLEVATEFLLIAATLVELKVRRLLPGRDDVDLDDELALWEERDLLLARCSSARRSRTCRPYWATWPVRPT
jgi:segregation and condensation protein A